MAKNNDKLKTIGNRIPFTTPEGYFDTLPARLQKRIAEEKQQPTIHKTASLFERTKPYLYFAAMLAGMYFIIMAAVKIFHTPSTPTTPPVTAENTAAEELFLDDDEWIYDLLADADY